MTESLAGNLMIASTLVPQSVFSRSVCLIVHHDENGAIGVMLNRPIVSPPAELVQMLIGGPAPVAPTAKETADSDDVGPAASCGSKTTGSKRGGSRLPKNQAANEGSPGAGDGGPVVGMIVPVGNAGDFTGALTGGANNGGAKNGGGWTLSNYPGNAIVHFGGPLSGPVVAVHGTRAYAEAEAGQGVFMAAQREHLEQLVKRPDHDFRLIIGHAAWTSAQLSQEFSAGYWHVLPATPETTLPVRIDLWPYLIRRATGASIASWVGAPDSGGRPGLN
jgi:putative transcriptional regulator